VYVVGAVLPMSERWWVIQSLEWGDNTRVSDTDSATRLRQDAVVTMIEPPEDGVIITNGKRYTVRPGDTLTSIASRQLGKASRWREITDSKGRHIRDPKNVKSGQIVKLP
jgi:nucleoid-associated protein YgaU